MKKISVLIVLIFLLGATMALGFFYMEESPIKKLIGETHVKKAKSFPIAPEKIKILFVGDMIFDRWIREVSVQKGNAFIFENIRDWLKSYDLVVGNLEGPITKSVSVSMGTKIGTKENYIFTFPPETARNLFENNIRLVNLGNNHILNFGKSGLSETENFLEGAKINHFGDTGNSGKRYFIKNLGGQKIAFINYNQFAKDAVRNTLADIAEVKKSQADHIFIYAHWGSEYREKPDAKIRDLAKEFIDSGADFLIGSHPHVIQEAEEYKGKKIFYSLGNFIFDQYFSEETKNGMAVEAVVDEKNISLRTIGIRMDSSGQTKLK